jgi:hypothetical protein
MRKGSATEDALAQVRAIRNAPETFDLKRDLAPFLRHKSNHVIAAAADAAKSIEYAQLTEQLVAAFEEIFPKAPERDQGCKALTAIVEALATKGEDAPDVYLKGVRYVQREGSFGPPVDVASALRGFCARGLVRTRHPEAMYRVVDLLVDKEPPARIGAVQALGDAGTREAELLLRLKVREGDTEGDVIAACFGALLDIAPNRSLPFVASYLERGDEYQVEAAALAIGEARCTSALQNLQDAWASHRSPMVRRTILVSIAMLRVEEGVAYLLSRLKQDPPKSVPDVLEALAIYRHDEAVSARIHEIVAARKLPPGRP